MLTHNSQQVNYYFDSLTGPVYCVFMEQTLIALISELAGLQAAGKLIQDRIDQIQEALASQRVPLHALTLTAPAPLTPAPAPAKKAAPSKAKLEALAKARAMLAQRRLAAVGGKGKKAGKR